MSGVMGNAHSAIEEDVKRMSIRTSLSLRGFVRATVPILAATAFLAARGSSGAATAPSSSSTSSRSTTTQRSNARSGPASGGAIGTVGNASGSRFTLSTSAGAKVTVDEGALTTYQRGTSSISASAITNGESVLVLGTVDTTNGTTIAAMQVIVQPAGSERSAGA